MVYHAGHVPPPRQSFPHTRLISARGTVKLKVLNVVIALLDGGVSDEDDEAEAPVRCILPSPILISHTGRCALATTRFLIQN